MLRFIQVIAVILSCCSYTVSAGSQDVGTSRPHPDAQMHLGFYLHAGWNYDAPFAVRSWELADYTNMFHLLKAIGYDRVMLWPLVETIPPPLSAADSHELTGYRKIIFEAQRTGLECWITFCPNLTVRAETSAQPWKDRPLMPNVRTMHFDNPTEKSVYFEHRGRILAILNNADGYVTIDGDPGGYAGARAEDFAEIFRADHAVLAQHGIAPQTQKVIPWIWCGWGTRGVWQEPIQPFVEKELNILKTNLPSPGEFLIGQCRSPFACRRINVDLANKLDLTSRSSMICYESVEYEPSAPCSKLQFDAIRQTLSEEQAFLNQSHGLFANAQTPIMVLPGIYFFARAARDTNYLASSDEQVLNDFAKFLGGDPSVLVPAWTCLQLGLNRMPPELAAVLRKLKLKGEAARYLPGGPNRYLEILSVQVSCRLQLLRATEKSVSNDADAAENLAKGASALITWWKQHHYTFEFGQPHPFAWNFAEPSQVELLRKWARKNTAGKKEVIQRAATTLSESGLLPLNEAQARLAEICGS